MTDDDSTPSRDQADLEERDREQPNLVTRDANLRADDDAEPERDERAALLDEVEDDE